MLVDFDEIVNDTVDVGVGVGVDGDVQLALIVAAAWAGFQVPLIEDHHCEK